MAETVLKGHRVSKGKAAGEALVSQQPIAFQGGINIEIGAIQDRHNELTGTSVAGKILVFPVGKGSSLGSYKLYEMKRLNTAPRAIINLRADPIVAVGAIFSDIPMVDRLDSNPLELIKSGDYVEVDADEGTVRVIGRSRPDSP
ncbi:aconitase X swivel domain-containing protein [Chloroflexota bacterium]